MPEPVTFRTFITAFTDFLTVAIHTILYERGLYPQDSFLSARCYNYSVRQSRNPKVCEWINDAVSAVQAELMRCMVSRVVMVIYDCGTNRPLERYLFDTARFPIVPVTEHATPLGHTDTDEPPGDQDNAVLPSIELEEQLRATMSKLSGCGATLAALPENCTFNLAIELKDDCEPPIRHPQAFVPVQPSLQKMSAAKQGQQDAAPGRDLGGLKTTPVRAVAAGDMLFEVWIEEADAKFASASGA